MRSLEEIQSGNRQDAVNKNIEAIRGEVSDFLDRGVLVSIDSDAVAALLVDGQKLANADRQKVNAALYAILINYVGAAKAAGWRYEQYAAGEKLVEVIERAATGNSLNGGVPVGYSVPVNIPEVKPATKKEETAQ